MSDFLAGSRSRWLYIVARSWLVAMECLEEVDRRSARV